MSEESADRVEYHSVKAFAREEPRIELIETMLRSVLAAVDLEYQGKPVRIDGFRLRDAEDWRTVRETSLQQNLGSFSTACNCHCEFCYEDGNPEGLFVREPRFVSLAEAKTRSRHVHDGQGMMRETKCFFEPLANPQFLSLLEVVRERHPDQVIDVTTNGSLLTSDVVARLADLKPVYVNLSLISANGPVRRRIMRDRRAQTAIDAIRHLRAREVPFMGTLVPLPDQGLQDVTETLEYLDAYDARLVRVAPPGLSRYHPSYRPGIFETWVPDLVEHLLAERQRLATPVIVSPFGFASVSIEPIVEGVIRSSPAASAGVRLGDKVTVVDGTKVVSRSHAASLLRRAMRVGVVDVEIARGSKTRRLHLQEPAFDADAYPHKPRGYKPLDFAGMSFGLVLPGSFKLQYVKQIHSKIQERSARHTLIVASSFYRELVENLVRDLPLPDGSSLALVVPTNGYFGGTVNVGDLWVLDDIGDAVRAYVRSHGKPDLLLIPSSCLSRWGRDLRGVAYTELEASLGIDIALIHCERIIL